MMTCLQFIIYLYTFQVLVNIYLLLGVVNALFLSQPLAIRT